MANEKLNQTLRKVLFKVFENEISTNPLNVKRFRVSLFEHLDTLDFLETNNYIINLSNHYQLKILSLDMITGFDPLIESYLHKINAIFKILQQAYRDDPDSSVLLSHLENELKNPRNELNRLVKYLTDLPISKGWSIDFNEVNASITPSESILKYKSVFDVIEAVKSWNTQPTNQEISKSTHVDKELVGDFTFLLHPIIRKSALQLFQGGHLREAVLNAMTAVFDFIRQRVGITDEDGDRLIGKVFSLESPYLILSEIETESGRSDQKGFVQIFKGAYQGIRNPNAHTLDHSLNNEMAAQYLIFASLMIRRIEEAKLTNSPM